MNKTRIKICGLTRASDVRAVVAAGVDAIGFVFTESPRRIDVSTAIRLIHYVPTGVLRVGLFLDQDRDEIERIVSAVPLDVLQFHGRETEQECHVFGYPWLKAVAMKDAGSARRAERDYPGAMGLLLDSHEAGQRGGSGKVFDWSLSRPVTKPIWLAGGLNAANVSHAIETVRPFAVDVSSGVEVEPGIKDKSKVMEFVKAVRNTENSVLKGNE